MKKIIVLTLLAVQSSFAQNPLNVGSLQISNDNVHNTLLNSGGVARMDMGFDGTKGYINFGAHTGGGQRDNILYMRGSDGNVGIGTINPSQKLEVNGHAVFQGAIITSIADNEGGQIQIRNPSKNSNGIASTWMIYNMTGGYGNSLQFWAYDNLGCGGGMCNNRFTIMDNGNVGIGSTNPQNKLDVNGTIHSKEVKVDINGWSDFVFKKEYNLPTLQEVEKQISKKGHLENIPSEDEVLKNGINLGEMDAKLLQKIEELTLYMIEQNKRMNKLEKENHDLKTRIDSIAK